MVIEVDAEQLSPNSDSGYGVSCRSNPEYNGNGYYFQISGAGFYRIVALVDGEYMNLVDWTETDVVNQGQDSNHIVIVCLGDYLAMYVNGELVIERYDDDGKLVRVTPPGYLPLGAMA